jgi:hypothetical protein
MLSRVQRAFVRLVRPLSESRPQSAAGSEQERTSRAALKAVSREANQDSPPNPESRRDPPGEPPSDERSPGGELPAASSEPRAPSDPGAPPASLGTASLSRGSTEWWMAMVRSNQQKQEELRLEQGKRQYQNGSRTSRKGFRFTAGTLLNRKAE